MHIKALYLFNLILGNLILRMPLSNSESLVTDIISHFSFSAAAIFFLYLLIKIFRKQIGKQALFFISLFFTFMIPVVGFFITFVIMSIVEGYLLKEGYYLYLISIYIVSIIVGLVTSLYWAIMAVVNYFILAGYKRNLNLKSTTKSSTLPENIN